MAKKVNISVNHVTRVEGHGNIRLRASDGKVEHVEWQVPEAPRFFEAMVRGRSFEDSNNRQPHLRYLLGNTLDGRNQGHRGRYGYQGFRADG